VRDAAVQVDGDLDGVERIAVAIDDERARRDRAQRRAREGEVVAVRGEGARLSEQQRQLRLAAGVAGSIREVGTRPGLFFLLRRRRHVTKLP
jgi:hypothetical protein